MKVEKTVILWALRAGTIVAFYLLLASCGSASHAKAGGAQGADPAGGVSVAAIPVQAAVVQYGALTAEHSAAGTIVPRLESQVAAEVSGVVVKVFDLAGAWVKEGDVVVQLDDSQLTLALQNAQASLDSAKIGVEKAKTQLDLANLTVERDQSLIKQKLIPQEQLDTDSSNAESAKQSYLAAQASVTQAQVQLKQAQLNLGFSAIKAPFTGQLATVNVQPGEYVSQNTSVFELVSPDREINFNVPPSDTPSLAVGTAVTFTYKGHPFAAHVSQSPSAPVNGVVPVVALFSSASQAPYGSVATVSYQLSLGDGVLVPISALQTNGNEEFVYVIQNAKAKTQPISVVAESGTTAAVTGLQSNAQVILNPPPGLLDNSPVRAVQVADKGGA